MTQPLKTWYDSTHVYLTNVSRCLLDHYSPTFDVFIPGPPHAKMRHRVTTIGGHARQYDAPKNITAQKDIQYEVSQAMQAQGVSIFPRDTPLACSITFLLPRPKSKAWKSIKGIRLDKALPSGGQDLDNLTKMVWDACNGLLWHDDRQVVVQPHVMKVYAPESKAVGTMMAVWPISEAMQREICEIAHDTMEEWL